MNITNQYHIAYKALLDLGLDTPIKPEDIKLTPELEKELDLHKAVMVLTPKIDSNFNTKDLFNRLKTIWDKDSSYIYSEWSKYFENDYQEPRVSFVYMDEDRGLYGKGKSIDDNRKQLSKIKKCRSLNPIEYMLLQVIYRDEPLDIGSSYTRFIDMGLYGFIRGGSWYYGGSAGVLALSLDSAPSYTSTDVGFRVSRDITSILPLKSEIRTLDMEYIPEIVKINGYVYRLEQIIKELDDKELREQRELNQSKRGKI